MRCFLAAPDTLNVWERKWSVNKALPSTWTTTSGCLGWLTIVIIVTSHLTLFAAASEHNGSLVMTTFSVIAPCDRVLGGPGPASRDSHRVWPSASRSAQIQFVFKNVNFLLVDCELSERGIAMSRLFLASSRPRTAGTKINSARLFSHLPRNLVRPPEILAPVINTW